MFSIAGHETGDGGGVSFGRAFLVGLMITAVACLCYVVTWEFISHFFMPDFVDKYAAYLLEQRVGDRFASRRLILDVDPPTFALSARRGF